VLLPRRGCPTATPRVETLSWFRSDARDRFPVCVRQSCQIDDVQADFGEDDGVNLDYELPFRNGLEAGLARQIMKESLQESAVESCCTPQQITA
jgi:hypothetical protein